MSDRMPEDLPVTERIDVMVGITRSKVIVEALTRKKTISKPQKFTTLHPNSRPQKARHPARHRAIILRRFQPTKRPLIQEATAIMATILMVLSSQWRGHNPGYDMKHMKHTKKWWCVVDLTIGSWNEKREDWRLWLSMFDKYGDASLIQWMDYVTHSLGRWIMKEQTEHCS